MSVREPFWMAPRRLRGLLDEAKLTPTAFTLLAYLGIAGSDRDDGLLATKAELASLLRVHKKTIGRALDQLADLGLTTDTRRPGVEHFLVRLTGALADENLGHAWDTPGTLTPPPMSQATSDTPSSLDGRDPSSHAGFREREPGTPRARARETETETETDGVVPTSTSTSTPRAGETEEPHPQVVHELAEGSLDGAAS